MTPEDCRMMVMVKAMQSKARVMTPRVMVPMMPRRPSHPSLISTRPLWRTRRPGASTTLVKETGSSGAQHTESQPPCPMTTSLLPPEILVSLSPGPTSTAKERLLLIHLSPKLQSLLPRQSFQTFPHLPKKKTVRMAKAVMRKEIQPLSSRLHLSLSEHSLLCSLEDEFCTCLQSETLHRTCESKC